MVKKVYVLIYLDLAMDVSMAFDTIYLKTIDGEIMGLSTTGSSLTYE